MIIYHGISLTTLHIMIIYHGISLTTLHIMIVCHGISLTTLHIMIVCHGNSLHVCTFSCFIAVDFPYVKGNSYGKWPITNYAALDMNVNVREGGMASLIMISNAYGGVGKDTTCQMFLHRSVSYFITSNISLHIYHICNTLQTLNLNLFTPFSANGRNG